MWLTRLALRNPVLILMLSLMTIVLGAVSLAHLSVDLFPNITVPTIRVATFYSGAGPRDVEKTITQPLERAVAAAPGVDRVESTSKQGASLISVWFNFDTNLDNAQFEVSQRIAQVMNQLPPGVQQPLVLKFDITNIPVVQVAASSPSLDEKQLYDLAYNVIEPQLERLPGVASASVGGGKVRQILVKAKRDALHARGLSLLDVVDVVRGANLLMPSGTLRTGDRDYNVFTNTQVTAARPLGELIVRGGGTDAAGRSRPAVRVADVADLEDGVADATDVVRIDGARGVYLRVLKQPGANTIAVVDAVRAALPKLRGVPSDVKLAVSFDQSHYIRAAVSALQHEALQGGLLAVVVILIFLVSLRATAIVAVAIPLSVVATFVLLYFTGQTLNVFTLGGLALGVGRLVDDSIVELENIHRHLGMGASRRSAVLAAAQEVAMPILVSTITTIVVFLPVLFLMGVARYLFLPLAATIAFSLSMSFLVSRTVTPLLCYYWLPSRHAVQEAWIVRAFSSALDRLDAGYARALAFTLRHRALTLLLIAAAFAGSLQLKKLIGTEFFPATDESQLAINYRAPIGTRVERTEDVTRRLEAVVQKALGPSAGSDGVYTTMIADVGLASGRTAIFSRNTGTHSGELRVNLKPRTQRAVSDVQAAEKVRAAIGDNFPGVGTFFFVGGIVKRILNFGAPAPIDIEILGYDLERGSAYAKQLLPKLRAAQDRDGSPLLTDILLSREENSPELDVTVDRQKAGVLGLSEDTIARTVLAGLHGNTEFAPILFSDPETGNSYFVNVRFDDAYRSQVSDLREISLRTPSGAMVSLDTVAQVQRSSGPVLIERKYMERVIHVTANVAPDKSLGAAAESLRAILDELPAPDGTSVQIGGQIIEQEKAFRGLFFAALMALALVYMVLASQFRSLIDPLVIMFSVPLGVSGVFLSLYLTDTTLNVNSFMGIIMMVGIVVSNGVLLVDFANVLRGRGKALIEATVEAGRTRLRPILMTTIATVFGLLPMAAGIGEGSETNLPLARAVIGGLTVSTIFTLFLVPTLYTLLDRFAKRSAPDADDDEAGAAGPADAQAAAGGAHVA